MTKTLELCKNDVVSFLQKNPADFTLSDIIMYVRDRGIEMVNFMYPAADGRLKTLNFIINDLAYLESILVNGERVDGSSLFPFISAGSSDLYVVPRLRTAFRDPFAPLPTLTMLCSYFDNEGRPLESSPEHTLAKACEAFTESTGLVFHAMGELEFYVIAPDPGMYPATDQRGYHESGPFAKFNDFRTRCMSMIAATGGKIKYGHSEVGNFTLDGKVYEQNEIEFLPVDAREAADQLMLAKWVIRNLAAQEGLDITFAPKITTGKAGSGLHVHMRLMDKEGKSVMVANDRLSDAARTAIAGIMDLAPALTAFGNTNPTSYFRLVPHQEAPTNVCWGDRNRSVLVRVPLGWTAHSNMCAKANGHAACDLVPDSAYAAKQTFEIRSADGSADIYMLLAGLAVAVRHGFEMPDALDVAARYYVDVDIHKPENAARLAALPTLPANCHASADCLEARADVFSAKGVFAPAMLQGVARKLRSFDEERACKALADTALMLDMVGEHFHCG
ncbi:MAG: glutamine synthetase family protein [Muribaculaceae bacterium]|nr:glutamine synthetase family protein [Muribaculaceae bacterium]